MNEETLTLVINGLLKVAIIVLIGYVLPKLSVLVKTYVIQKLVEAAEQKIKGSGMGVEKKVQVLDWLEAMHIKADEFVDVLIESAVFELNKKKDQLN